jgi:hypothetical protein
MLLMSHHACNPVLKSGETANPSVDDPEAVEGAPGAIQIMGKPMKDEELIEIMKAVETVLNPHQINSEPFIKPPQSRSRLSTEERRKLEIAFSSGRNLTN